MRIEDEQKYFTAKEAREVSDEINSGRMKEELNWIYDLINKARFEGEHSITFSNKTLISFPIYCLANFSSFLSDSAINISLLLFLVMPST